jgi:hypothetical protein
MQLLQENIATTAMKMIKAQHTNNVKETLNFELPFLS